MAWRAVLVYGASQARMYRTGDAKITEYTAGGGASIPLPHDALPATADEVGTRLLAVGRYHVRVGMGRPTAIYDLDTPALTSVDSLVFPKHAAAAASPSATEVALAGVTTTGFRVVRMQVPAGSFQEIPVGNLELGTPDELIATWHANQLWLLTRTHGDYGVRVIDVDTGALLGRRDDLGPLFGLVDPVVPLNGFSPKELLTAVSAPDGTVMAAHQIGPWAGVVLRWSPSCGP
ncbi:MAG: hypothetical protein IT374_16780 [Polyangiaceae bacterium]|nr:hypothetical protein [Polyangiaceae bacterium]